MEPQQTDPLGIAALVLGILAWLTICCGFIPLVGLFSGLLGLAFGLLSIILGVISYSRVQSSPEQYSGKGLAIGGAGLGCLDYIVCIGLIILVFGLGIGTAILEQM